MGYALLSQAKQWISDPFGTSDDRKLTNAVNDIRQFMYSWYSALAVGLDVEECFELQRFRHVHNDPREGASMAYLGVTLPRYFETVEAMWHNDIPVQLFDRWRTWQHRLTARTECGLAKVDMGYAFPTEREMLRPGRLKVAALDGFDVGQQVIITGTAPGGDPIHETLMLGPEPVLTSRDLASIRVPGGIAKSQTRGRVVIAEEDGRVLVILSPDEQVPAYTRIRISGTREGCPQVVIRGSRRFIALFDPSDVVETDNRNVWDAMARFLRLNRKGDRTSADMASEKDYLQQAQALMLGDKSRQTGKATQADIRFVTPSINMHALGRRRRW